MCAFASLSHASRNSWVIPSNADGLLAGRQDDRGRPGLSAPRTIGHARSAFQRGARSARKWPKYPHVRLLTRDLPAAYLTPLSITARPYTPSSRRRGRQIAALHTGPVGRENEQQPSLSRSVVSSCSPCRLRHARHRGSAGGGCQFVRLEPCRLDCRRDEFSNSVMVATY
jgi:hypothetical protein